MRHLPQTSREIISRLLKEGWQEQPKNGSSHRIFKKPGSRERIVVPHPRRDFGKGFLHHVYTLAGWASEP
ncbi:MAG: type II toxin-antitoxin system HicA family toxin [Beijerinckiaceae bacterium]|nr:type II toxin-antitoxin system HicA family toxin [Beijerinckiaceae bacterium]MCZ8301191.1 type II toxin-antitoxin system HicA family toxin [Beijerinckiaceae bacterium]